MLNLSVLVKLISIFNAFASNDSKNLLKIVVISLVQDEIAHKSFGSRGRIKILIKLGFKNVLFGKFAETRPTKIRAHFKNFFSRATSIVDVAQDVAKSSRAELVNIKTLMRFTNIFLFHLQAFFQFSTILRGEVAIF